MLFLRRLHKFSCGPLLDPHGHHRAVCSRAGVSGRRGYALESVKGASYSGLLQFWPVSISIVGPVLFCPVPLWPGLKSKVPSSIYAHSTRARSEKQSAEFYSGQFHSKNRKIFREKTNKQTKKNQKKKQDTKEKQQQRKKKNSKTRTTRVEKTMLSVFRVLVFRVQGQWFRSLGQH